MRHGVVGKRLGRDTAHRKAMLNNLATSVLAQGLKEEPMDRQVVTTVQKAKSVRGLVDRLITYAKQGDLSARRQAARFVKDKLVLRGLFDTLGNRYGKRAGGYTRVLKVSANRHGDNAQMALITLVEEEIRPRPKKKVSKVKAKAEKKVNITKAESKLVPAQAKSVPSQPASEPHA